MTGMTSERLAAIREQVEWERAQTGLYWPRELPGKANLDRADLLDEVLRLRAGIEDIRDEGWEPWLNRDWQHLDTVRNDCNDLLDPTGGEDRE